MSSRRTERLLNLVICLLATSRYLSAEEIRRIVPGYSDESGDDDSAFRRMFERDKEDLRQLGIPLEVGSTTGWDGADPGYRIPAADYQLPEIQLEPDEAAAVGLAARAWRSAALGAAASQALRKLHAAGVPAESGALSLLEPHVEAAEPSFEAMLAAARAGQPVEFDYRTANRPQPATRRVEPWGLVSWRGRWYLVGHDRDRGEERVFRLSRVTGAVRPAGAPGSVQPPAGVDLAGAVAAYERDRPDRSARLRVRAGRAGDLRREAAAGSGPGEWDELEVGFSDPDRLADRLVGYGSDVVVLAPPDLRAAVVQRLRALAGPEQQVPAAGGAGRVVR